MDSWTLGYQWLAADVNSDLVLASVTHTGDVGGTSKPLTVTLGYVSKDNRVDYGEGYPVMSRYRLNDVISETGAQTVVTYNGSSVTGACNSAELTSQAAVAGNNLPCFPQWWSGGDFGGTPTMLWYYKYTVAKVTVNDATGGQPSMPVSYTYCNDAACDAPGTGAAWHYDTDADLVPAKDKSWAQWRGYAYVRVITGASGGTQSETDYTFARGMSADPVPATGGGFTYPAVTITPSETAGTTQSPAAVTDASALNGSQLEAITWDGLNGSHAAAWCRTRSAGRGRRSPPRRRPSRGASR